jgi:small multidrug resistance pump
MILKSILSVNYIFWLVASAIFFAVGEFLSKKFALSPKASYVIFILLAYCVGTLFWLPAILQKNQLSVVGTMWSVMGLLATILIGVLVFREKLSIVGVLGIIFAFISIILLSST